MNVLPTEILDEGSSDSGSGGEEGADDDAESDDEDEDEAETEDGKCILLADDRIFLTLNYTEVILESLNYSSIRDIIAVSSIVYSCKLTF